MSPGSSQSIRAWENSLLPPIGAPRIPPEQPFSRIILLGYKLRELDELHMAAHGLDDGSGSVKAADSFVAVGKA